MRSGCAAWMLVSAALPAGLAVAAPAPAAVSLAVTRLQPPPNYPETSDGRDEQQLTDGRTHGGSFWTSPEAVGWVNQTPVAIELRAAMRPGAGYRLSLLSARQPAAGVQPPRRVDVYCAAPGGGWSHAGASQLAAPAAGPAGSVAVDVALRGCAGPRLQAVVHATGAFVMLDEISLAEAAAAGPADGPEDGAVPAPVAAPEADSRSRLEAALQALADAGIARSLAGLDPQHGHAWLAPPWGALLPPPARPRLAVQALPGAGARYVIGLANPTPQPLRFTVAPADAAAATATLRRLQPAVAADGQPVFDALVPAPADGGLELAPGQVAFLFASEAGAGAAGPRRWEVRDGTGARAELVAEVAVADALQPGPADAPRVLVWTYARDRPIWQPGGEAAMVAALAGAGVNVFEIHPADWPQPYDEAAWPRQAAALARLAGAYRGHGLLLLLAGSGAWRQLSAGGDGEGAEPRLARWLALVRGTLAEAGYGPADWALYLLDEPHGADLGRLADVIDRLKGLDGALRFYANPIAGQGLDASTVWRLRGLAGRVAFWQPRAGPAFERSREALDGAVGAELWMYANPPAPARSAAPACYRELGVKAFRDGATGVGFWSFSDTRGSSAWTDFDGPAPDWAVAYEGGAPFTPGRRWEAFVQGVADFAALRFCARQAGGAAAEQCRAYRAALDQARPDCAGWW